MSTSTTEAPPPTEASPVSGFAGLRLFVMLLGMGVAVALSLLAIVYFVPDGNDYSLATVDKHTRLAQSETQKLVLVGGSNLAYGIDSALLEKATGRRVVNMGMNGYLGVRFMLEEIKPQLKPSDMVVIAFEYDNYYKSVDGSGRDLLMIVKTHLPSLGALSMPQLIDVASWVPYAAQKKVLRMVGDALKAVKPSALEVDADADNPDALVASVETHDGFNRYGDLESHLGIDWSFGGEEGIDLTKLGIDHEVVGVIKAFSDEMKARDITVVVSYCPLLKDFHLKHSETIDALHQQMVNAGLTVPLAPETFVYEAPLFFDTVYHLNAKGRKKRTQTLADSLMTFVAQP